MLLFFNDTLNNMPRGSEFLDALAGKIPTNQLDYLKNNMIVINPRLNITPQPWWANSFDWYIAIELIPEKQYGPLFRHGQTEFNPVIGVPHEAYSEKQCFFGLKKAMSVTEARELYNLRPETKIECMHEFTVIVPKDWGKAFLFCGPVKGGTGYQAGPNRITADLIAKVVKEGKTTCHKFT